MAAAAFTNLTTTVIIIVVRLLFVEKFCRKNMFLHLTAVVILVLV